MTWFVERVIISCLAPLLRSYHFRPIKPREKIPMTQAKAPTFPVQGVLIDWGGVLVAESPSQMAYYAHHLGVPRQKLLNAITPVENVSFNLGHIDEAEFWRIICEKLGVPMPRVESLWYEGRAASLERYEGVWEIARILRGRGYKVGVLSNLSKPSTRFFRDQRYQDEFDETIFSCEVGLVKPDPQIYILAADRLGVAPSQTVMVDNLVRNIDALQMVGMHGSLYTNVANLRASFAHLGIEV